MALSRRRNGVGDACLFGWTIMHFGTLLNRTRTFVFVLKKGPFGFRFHEWGVAIFSWCLVQSSRNLQLLRCDFDVGFVRKG